jgi:hypothetical protein
VDFQADDGLVFGEDRRRDRRIFWNGFNHNGTEIIASAGFQWSAVGF